MLLTLISLLLAFAMGFTAFRAGICTVLAVAEVRSSGTARVFLSFLKVILWVVLVTGLRAQPITVKGKFILHRLTSINTLTE